MTLASDVASGPPRVGRAYAHIVARLDKVGARDRLAVIPDDKAFAWIYWAADALTPWGRRLRRHDLVASIIAGGTGESTPETRGAVLGWIASNLP